jgi:hypothetical protein
LAFSATHLLIYRFVVVEGVDIAPPATTPEITQPLWSLPIVDARTDCGALSQRLYNEVATQFILTTDHKIINLFVPNNEDKAPHFIEMMEFNCPEAATFAIGFEKTFVQHLGHTILRLSFAWGTREVGSVNTGVLSSCVCSISLDYPTTCNGAQLPKFDKETGRIIQDSMNGVRVIDTALFAWLLPTSCGIMHHDLKLYNVKGVF